MPSDRKPSLILPVALALPLLLAVGYLAAYYLTVGVSHQYDESLLVVSPDALGEIRVLEYRVPVDQSVAVWFFAPAHWLDRRIRPRVWEPTE